jgi:plastocyanin
MKIPMSRSIVLLPILLLAVMVAGAEAATIKGTVEGGKRLKRSPAVVYLAEVAGEFIPPAKNPVMDQHNMTFIPHVLPVRTGTTVDFLNSDEVKHNIFSPDHEKYNLGTWPRGEIKQHTFAKQGVYTQLCNVHPEMQGFIVVLDTPYFVLTDEDGNFEMKDVPPGNYTIKAWHEKLHFDKEKVTLTEAGVDNLALKSRKSR